MGIYGNRNQQNDNLCSGYEDFKNIINFICAKVINIYDVLLFLSNRIPCEGVTYTDILFVLLCCL